MKKIMLLLSALLCACAEDSVLERRITVEHWDTVVQLGGKDANDTTLVYPASIVRWNDLMITLDYITQSIQAFSVKGPHLWSAGRKGRGPGELEEISTATPGPDGLLWLFDRGNRKLVKYDANGAIAYEQPHELPVSPRRASATADVVVITTQTANRGLLVTTPDLVPLSLQRTP